MSLNDINSLSHTKWNCKYHIVFAPKYRRKVFYKEKRAAIGKILRQLCEWKSVKIIEAEACPDHIHLFVEIPPKLSISGFMGCLKGKSSTMLYEQFGELKYKYRNREFWCRGYCVDTVGKNETRIAEYIKNQLKRRLTRAHTSDSQSFRCFLPFCPWRATARLRPKEQKSLENPRLSDAKQFCRSRNARRQGKGRREYFVYSQGL